MIGDKGRSRLIWVFSLIDDQGRWNEALVRKTFPPIDVNVILKIKLSQRRPEDFLAWQHEKNGCFSIRRAYRVGLRLAQLDQQGAASSSAPFGDKPIWKQLWKCKVPLKVRIFAWKVVSGGLATEGNKRRRHLPVSGQCQICGHDIEDTFHALFQCPHAAALWMAMRDVWPIPVIKRDNSCTGWLECFTDQSLIPLPILIK